jgi:hypothetical protein
LPIGWQKRVDHGVDDGAGSRIGSQPREASRRPSGGPFGDVTMRGVEELGLGTEVVLNESHRDAGFGCDLIRSGLATELLRTQKEERRCSTSLRYRNWLQPDDIRRDYPWRSGERNG